MFIELESNGGLTLSVFAPIVQVSAPAEEPDDGGGDMQRMVTRYINERVRAGDLNARSAAATRSKLRLFAASVNVTPGKLTRRHVERFLGSNPDWAPAYRRSLLYAIRGFSQWLVMRGTLKVDITLGIKTPHVPRGMLRALPTDDARAVAAVATRDPRTRVIVLLQLQEGARRIEVSQAQLGDVDLRRGTIALRGKGYRGEVSRVVPLSDQTRRALEDYMRATQLGPGPLIRSLKNPDRGISPQHVSHLVLQVLRDAGVKQYNGDGRSSHALRHTCAQDVLDLGADIRQVQKMLGHATIKTTEEYLRGEVRDLREAMAGRSY